VLKGARSRARGGSALLIIAAKQLDKTRAVCTLRRDYKIFYHRTRSFLGMLTLIFIERHR